MHCDVCHKVNQVDLSSDSQGFWKTSNLTPRQSWRAIGPPKHPNVRTEPRCPQPLMGSVQRNHYQEASFCAGCHELNQPVFVPNATIDESRWPSGLLPIHSTYSELQMARSLKRSRVRVATCRPLHTPKTARTWGTSSTTAIRTSPPAGLGCLDRFASTVAGPQKQ